MEYQWVSLFLMVGFLGVEGKFDWATAVRSVENATSSARHRLDSFKILPGTKWCGAGSIATDDNELGSHPQTDSCCRAHDMCNDYIEGGQSKHGLTNHAPYTRLNCKCDEEFLSCLRKSTDDVKVSTVVGTLYFDLLRQKCFKLEHKITGCEEYNPVKLKCDKYSLDPNSPKSWQWFDVPSY